MNLKIIVDETYEQLKQHKLVKTQYEFSRDYLKRSNGYYGYLKSSGADTTAEVVLALWAECRRQKQQWRQATEQHTNILVQELFKGLADTADELEHKVGDGIMEGYLARR